VGDTNAALLTAMFSRLFRLLDCLKTLWGYIEKTQSRNFDFVGWTTRCTGPVPIPYLGKSEASRVIALYDSLTASQRQDLLNFLRSL